MVSRLDAAIKDYYEKRKTFHVHDESEWAEIAEKHKIDNWEYIGGWRKILTNNN